MNMKEHILIAMMEQFEQWEQLLATLNNEQIVTPLLPSAWSIKDIIAHLRAWQQRSISRLEAAHSNLVPEFPQWLPETNPDLASNTEKINAWIFKTFHEAPWAEVHNKWKNGYLRLIDLGKGIPERDLLDGGRYPWLNGYPLALILIASYDHHQEHFEKLTAWQQEQG